MTASCVTPTQLWEVVQSSPLEVRVDKDAGVIRGVRILGAESRNGRTYTLEAIRGAVGLYEGQNVNYDHPPKGAPDQERQFGDRAGWLRNVREIGGGLSGDLHYLKSDPRADKLCEAAERRPESFGLSHNAEGRVVKKDGKTLVEEITRVRSVDVVADPATTRSLFESIENNDLNQGVTTMPKTMRQIADAHKTSKRGKALVRFLEQDGLPMAELPVEAPATDPNAEIAAAFEKAAMSILKKLFTGEMDEAEGLGKIKELLGKKEEVVADAGEVTTPAPESLQADVARLRSEIAIRDQLQESGVKISPARVKALVPLEPAERKELVESWKVAELKSQGFHERVPRPASTAARM
ncbi:MAG: hypothetical protein ABIH03_14610, partial [Pseudomonadota bacterium]